MKAMISQPMSGLMADELYRARNKAKKYLKDHGYDFVDSLFNDKWHPYKMLPKLGTENYPLFQLSRSLEQMSKCDAVYFCKDWEKYRGCRIEHQAAKAYGLTILYEE